MNNQKKNPGTPNYHIASARKGQPANYRLTRTMRTHAEIEREIKDRAFKCGFLFGIGIAALIFGIILWVWAIPTMDGCVEAMKAVAS